MVAWAVCKIKIDYTQAMNSIWNFHISFSPNFLSETHTSSWNQTSYSDPNCICKFPDKQTPLIDGPLDIYSISKKPPPQNPTTLHHAYHRPPIQSFLIQPHYQTYQVLLIRVPAYSYLNLFTVSHPTTSSLRCILYTN